MKMPTSAAIKGYAITVLYLADFFALIFVNRGIVVTGILGVVFILGAIKFYIGVKAIKSFEFNAKPFKLKIVMKI